jgi:hypothetical protein
MSGEDRLAALGDLEHPGSGGHREGSAMTGEDRLWGRLRDRLRDRVWDHLRCAQLLGFTLQTASFFGGAVLRDLYVCWWRPVNASLSQEATPLVAVGRLLYDWLLGALRIPLVPTRGARAVLLRRLALAPVGRLACRVVAGRRLLLRWSRVGLASGRPGCSASAVSYAVQPSLTRHLAGRFAASPLAPPRSRGVWSHSTLAEPAFCGAAESFGLGGGVL